jgi:hypothetical protein
MDPAYYGLVEILFTSSVVFGLAGWQLWSVRRELRRDRERAASAPSSGDEGA